MIYSLRISSLALTLLSLSMFAACFGSVNTARADSCTNGFASGSAASTGYGASYNLFSTAKELLVQGTDCSATNFTFKVGSGDAAQYVYKQGYVWTGTRWQSFTLASSTGQAASDVWFTKDGATTLNATAADTYVVGYVCQQIGGTWKCGCRDSACATPGWQLQKVGMPSTLASGSGPHRGANVDMQGLMSNFDDLDSLAAQGAKLARVEFYGQSTWLRDLNPPYAINTGLLNRIDQLLDHAQSLGMSLYFDAHVLPGCTSTDCNRRDNGGMGLWSDDQGTRSQFQNLDAELWGTIANRYKNRGPELFGYDLINEPCTDTTSYYDEFLSKVIPAIRAVDATHRILIEPNCGKWVEPLMFNWPQGTNLAFSAHIYDPQSFAMQRMGSDPSTPTWPNGVPGFSPSTLVTWIDGMAKVGTDHNVPVVIGEFSAIKWANPYGGNQYVKDLIDQFEKHGFYWSYFAWNDWYGWRPYLDDSCCGVSLCPNACNTNVSYNTERMQMLKSYWAND